MLNEQRRQQLDGIVRKMIVNKESDKNIRFVVDDFTRKYSNEQEPTATENVQKMSKLQAVTQGVKQGFSQAGNALVGATKGVGSTIAGTGKLFDQALGQTAGRVANVVTGKGFTPTVPDPRVEQKVDSVLEAKGVDQKAGKLGEQIGEFLIPGGASSKVGKAAQGSKILANSPRIAKVAGIGAKALSEGGINATIATAQGGNKKDVVTAGLLSGGLSAAGEFVGPILKESAKKSYSQALGATTKQNKQISEKIVPELINRKEVALTRGGLLNKATDKVEKIGEDLNAAYDALPKNAKSDWKPILEKIKQAKDEVVVNGVAIDVGRFRALQAIEKSLYDVIGGGVKDVSKAEVSVENARKVRQILDRSISKSTKTFGKTGQESNLLDAQKEAANAIRSQLAKEHPDIAAINKEFNFWKNVQDVVGSTIQRTRSQGSLTGELAQDTGAIIGSQLGGTIGKAVTGGFSFNLLKKAIQSTAWRTTSSVVKNKLADHLAKGELAKAAIIIQRMVGNK